MARIELTGNLTDDSRLEEELPDGLKPGLFSVNLEAIDPDQAWFSTPEWQAGEREADADVVMGRVETFCMMEGLLDDLVSND